jgi:hypothetical protein
VDAEPRAARVDIHRGVDVPANSDIISGYRFCATMQLRTPLRVLLRHGELHHGLDREPPQIAREMWEGIWIPELRSWRELGIDLKEIPLGTMASDIGPVPADGGEYLQFLIAVRTVAEGGGSIESRRAAVAEIMADPAWRKIVLVHGGQTAALDRLFPPFVLAVSRMSTKVATALISAGFGSPASLASASDDELLAVTGVGPAIVGNIRRESETATDRNCSFVDRVSR